MIVLYFLVLLLVSSGGFFWLNFQKSKDIHEDLYAIKRLVKRLEDLSLDQKREIEDLKDSHRTFSESRGASNNNWESARNAFRPQPWPRRLDNE